MRLRHPVQFVSHMSQFVSHMRHLMRLRHPVQPIAFGVSFNQILQSQVRESYVTVRESYVTAYCIWSVIQSNPAISSSWVICHSSWVICYSLLHLECPSIWISNLNLLGLLASERGKRDLENYHLDWDLRMKKWHSKCYRLHFVRDIKRWQRPIGCPIFVGHFPQKSPIISGFLATNDTPNAIGCILSVTLKDGEDP